MNFQDSLQLFSFNALKQKYPVGAFMGLSEVLNLKSLDLTDCKRLECILQLPPSFWNTCGRLIVHPLGECQVQGLKVHQILKRVISAFQISSHQ